MNVTPKKTEAMSDSEKTVRRKGRTMVYEKIHTILNKIEILKNARIL